MSFDVDASILTVWNDATVGWEFTTHRDITVTHLGFLDPPGAAAHEVGVFDPSGTLLRSTTIDAGAVSLLLNGFRYESIAPIVLPADETYVLAGRTRGQRGVSSLGHPPVGLTFRPEISFVAGRTNGGAPRFSFPDAFTSPNFGYFGPNIQIQEVPEATTFAILMIGQIILAARRR